MEMVGEVVTATWKKTHKRKHCARKKKTFLVQPPEEKER
jgi:hypothetical protein